MSAVAVFKALGEPKRLAIIERLVAKPRQQIGVLTEGLGLSRQGARQHLQVLADAELVSLHPQGREVWIELESERLAEAKRFIEKLEREWDARLDVLKRNIENDPRDSQADH